MIHILKSYLLSLFKWISFDLIVGATGQPATILYFISRNKLENLWLHNHSSIITAESKHQN